MDTVKTLTMGGGECPIMSDEEDGTVNRPGGAQPCVAEYTEAADIVARFGARAVKDILQSFAIVSEWPPEKIEKNRRKLLEECETKEPEVIAFLSAFCDACIAMAKDKVQAQQNQTDDKAVRLERHKSM